MSLRTQRTPLPVPDLGVRRDVAPLVATKNMLTTGKNVMVWDATVRPRPASTRDYFGEVATFWASILGSATEPVHASYAFRGTQPVIIAQTGLLDGTLKFEYSTDEGVTWNDTTDSGTAPPTDTLSVCKFIKCGDYLYAFVGQADIRSPGGQDLYYVDVSGFPASGNLVWNRMGLTIPTYITPPVPGHPLMNSFNRVVYDSTNDLLIAQAVPFEGTDGSYRDDGLFILVDASTPLSSTPYHREPQVTRANPGWKTRRLGGLSETIENQQIIFRSPLAGQANLIDVRTVSLVDGTQSLDYQDRLLGSPPVDAGVSGADTVQYVTDSALIEFDISTEASTTLYDGGSGAQQFKVARWDSTTVCQLLGLENWRTDNGFSTATEFEDCPFDVERIATLSSDSGARFYVLEHNPEDYTEGRLWIVHGSEFEADVDPDQYGDELTGIAQGNMDAEPYAFFSGTTKRLLKLNRGLNYLEDLSPRHLLTSWTHYSGNVWYTAMNVDPQKLWFDDANVGGRRSSIGALTAAYNWYWNPVELRVYVYSTGATPADDPDTVYTSPGVYSKRGYINGQYSLNRWVFRFLEKNNDKYIVATNGQGHPVCYTDSDDRFRQLGDADGDGRIDSPETLAPKAFCAAVSNNRLVLGNLPDISPYAVKISDPLDFDAGWDSDEIHLADTQGSIVAMRELSALSIAILKEDAVYHGISQVEFMGVTAPMRFELIKAGIVGPCSDASVVYLPDGRLCYLGRDGGVYIYDGVIPRDAGRHIRHLVQSTIDPDRFREAWGMMDTTKNVLWFFYPSLNGLNNRGICMVTDLGEPWPCYEVSYPAEWRMSAGLDVYFHTDKTYREFGTAVSGDMYRDYAATSYNAFEGGRFGMVLARANSSWYTQLWGDVLNYTDSGTEIDCVWEHGWDDFGDSLKYDTVHEVHHNMELGAGDQFEVTLRSMGPTPDNVTETVSTLDSDTYRRRGTYRQTGRKHGIGFRSLIRRLFRWGGAEVSLSTRGNR